MANLPNPPELTYGQFVGWYGKIIGDSAGDVDRFPDVVPATGSIVFHADIAGDIRLTELGLTATPEDITCTLDNEGHMIDALGIRGVWLMASDSSSDPTGFTYTITKTINGARSQVTGVYLPGGETIDLINVFSANPAQPMYLGNDSQMTAVINDPDSTFRAAVIDIAGDGVVIQAPVNSVNGRQGNVTGLAEASTVTTLAAQVALLAPKSNPTFTGSVTVPTGTAATDAVNKGQMDTALSNLGGGSTPDAQATVKGKLALAGDLAGTAAAPTVPALANKQDKITPGPATSYIRADLQFAPMNATAVGLGSVNNTSDAAKPISTAQAARMDTLEGGSGPVLLTQTWISAVTVPTTALGTTISATLTGATTITLGGQAATRAGQITLVLTQGTGGSKTITWPSAVKWSAGTKPILSTAAGSVDVITLTWTGAIWIGILGAKSIA